MAHHTHPDILSAKHLSGIANAAAEIIAGAQQAYHCGLFPPMIRKHLLTVQHDLIRLLALHEDGPGYGRAPVELIDYFRTLEQVATDLLEVEDDETASPVGHRNHGH